MRSRENVKTNNSVFQELKKELETVIRFVCETHQLLLAMAWVPCSACNGLKSVDVDYCGSIDYSLSKFLRVSECSHLRKGWVAEWALSLSSPDMLYFPTITKLSVDDYPFVPYARMCKLSGWFIMCLRSNYTGDDIYVLEFFWSTSSEDYENIQTRLNKLLGTMEEKLENFEFASGQKLGQSSYVEVIDVKNNKKTQKVLEIQATRTFSDSDPSTDQSSTSVSYVRPWR
jgi:hypothetical protein